LVVVAVVVVVVVGTDARGALSGWSLKT